MGLPNTSTRARHAIVFATVAALGFCVSGCGVFFGRSEARDIAEIHVDSPQLRDGKPLPREYSCKGTGASPPLRWSSEPLPDAKSIAIVVDDNSASGAAVHWVVFNIDPRTTVLGEGAASDPTLAASQATGTGGKAGYTPPCQPKGTYRFSVYALNGKVVQKADATLQDVLRQIADQTIGRGRLTAIDIE